MAELPRHLEYMRRVYMRVVDALAEGREPLINGDAFLPVFETNLEGDQAFVDWLVEQIRQRSEGTVHLTRIDKLQGAVGVVAFFELAGPGWIKTIAISPSRRGVEIIGRRMV